MAIYPIRQLADNGGTAQFVPVTAPEAVKFEDGADLTTAIGSIATIETSPATATHAVGDYIVWNGQLYKVTSAIAVGETLTVNTNIVATNIGSELNAGLADITGFDDTISPTAWPFTCPADGMFFAGIIPTQSGDAYAYYTKNGNFFLSISSHSGLQQSACAPVRKGDVINRSGSSNASNRGWLEPFKSSN